MYKEWSFPSLWCLSYDKETVFLMSAPKEGTVVKCKDDKGLGKHYTNLNMDLLRISECSLNVE